VVQPIVKLILCEVRQPSDIEGQEGRPAIEEKAEDSGKGRLVVDQSKRKRSVKVN